MRIFLVLCVAALAVADQLPYNYAPVSHVDSSFGRSEGLLSGGYNGVAVGGGSNDGISGGLSGVADGGFDKEFYTFTANEDEFDPTDVQKQIESSLKKNLRVIFIKGPENKALENAVLNLAKHASEQKTAIYVLNKQADIGALANKLNSENSHNHNKPEVHFVKYRTPEDAHSAQRAIQSQYDQLGGSTQSHDGGIAPVLDFATKGQIGVGHHGDGQHDGAYHDGQVGGFNDQGGAAIAPGATYLPANFYRL